MKCDHCYYCKGGCLPESYEEEWWCTKGYGDPMEIGYCHHIFWFQIRDFILYPYYVIRDKLFWKRLLRKHKND